MPHIPVHPSAEKRERQSLKRYVHNHAIKARAHTAVKRALEAIGATDRTAAEQALREAAKVLSKAASKGTIHRNTVSRRISRMSARLHKTHVAKTSS
ncbi:MAG TPA: 30S ribosomal protein S20 [Candidatus Binataceae bacterium]|nr:30S ribosomal protein S20 [Candidatus Binataceae bacterium]